MSDRGHPRNKDFRAVTHLSFTGLLEEDAVRLAHALHYHGHTVVVDDLATGWSVDFTAYKNGNLMVYGEKDVDDTF